jgi:transposase InsO family protein
LLTLASLISALYAVTNIIQMDAPSMKESDAGCLTLRDHGIEISMDGRGRCHDNIFVERLWWTVKHEWVYLRPGRRHRTETQPSRVLRLV